MVIIMKHNRIILNLFIAFLIISFMIGIFASAVSSSAASPAFAKKYPTVTVGKSVQYRIKHLNKKHSVTFSVSNPSIASIHSKTGKLLPKKIGKLTVKAIIYNTKHQKIYQLKDTVTIEKKKEYIPNASFQINKTINPWNFTLTLSCNRILLKNEIKNSNLTIFPKGKKAPKLRAEFLELSPNGKEITYLFNNDSQKKLCPGDFSMDGNYTVQSSHFSKKLSLTYQERLSKNTLSGFVFKQDGNPVKNAMLSLKTASGTKQYSTDINGHYMMKNIDKPISLTVAKEGYQTVSLKNPPLSAKGVSCENIILRSLEDTNLSLEFFVTDAENHPIPNTAVTIALDKNSTTEKTESTSASFDLLSKKDIITTQNTDSAGTLYLSNDELSANFPAPCSDFEIDQKTKLTYTSAYQPSSNHHTLLSKKELNINDQYTIYIGSFSSDNTLMPYHVQKISFSFASLSTNHARFHIQLSKCSNLSIQSLSLSYENDLSSLSSESLLLRLFHPEKRVPIYQYKINYHSFQQIENELFLSSLQLPVSLLDGKYYLQLQLSSKEGETIAETPVSPVIIQNANLAAKKLTLKPLRFARILTYTNLEKKVPEMASFHLYQKADESYFFIDTFSTDFFTSKDNTIFTAKLLLSHLIENESYLLLPATDEIMGTKNLLFTAVSENTFTTKKEAIYSLLPLAQIFCDRKTSFSNSVEKTIRMDYSAFHNITSDFVRTSTSYPNCVLALYNTDGTLLTAALTNKITQNTIPSSFSNYKASIIDIYTNKENIITTQSSYLNSNFS